MARKEIVRTLDAYSIHGHVNAGDLDESLLDYEDFFQRLTSASSRGARFNVGVDTVALTDVSTGKQLSLHLVSGNASTLPLIFDEQTGTAEEVDPGRNRFLVSGIWVIADPAARIVVIERKRPGVPIYQVERFLSMFGREELDMPGLTISLNPVPSASFAEEIRSFTRIREASITLRRPNHSWTKSAMGMLGELPESNAAEIQVQLNADRGKSLEKSKGVIKEILELASNPVGPLKNATVKGMAPNFEGERSISLNKHTVKGSARIDQSKPAHEQLEALETVAERLVHEATESNNQLEE